MYKGIEKATSILYVCVCVFTHIHKLGITLAQIHYNIYYIYNKCCKVSLSFVDMEPANDKCKGSLYPPLLQLVSK